MKMRPVFWPMPSASIAQAGGDAGDADHQRMIDWGVFRLAIRQIGAAAA